MIKAIPLNKLVQSPRNVRRHSDTAADAELKAVNRPAILTPFLG